MKIYTNELCHMTNMAAMPIYCKNLNKSSSPEPISIMYVSTTKVVQIKFLGFTPRSIWSHRLLNGKK